MPTIMNKKTWNSFTDTTLNLNKCRHHYYKGSGPIFAYSFYLTKPWRPWGEYWIRIANDMHVTGANIILTSPKYQYDSAFRNLTVEKTANGGLFRVRNIHLSLNDVRTIEIQFNFKNEEVIPKYREFLKFFGF